MSTTSAMSYREEPLPARAALLQTILRHTHTMRFAELAHEAALATLWRR